MQRIGPLFAKNPDLIQQNAKNLAAVTPEELMGK
jgi:hypothetical protein